MTTQTLSPPVPPSPSPPVAPQAPTLIKLEHALRAVELLRNELQIDRCLVAGSIRRRVRMVKDVELVCPRPADGQADPLLERIREKFLIPGWHGEEEKYLEPVPDTGGLFAPAAPKTRPAVRIRPNPLAPIGLAMKGAKDGFRYCQLNVPSKVYPDVAINVDIFRYDPGPMGNKGWIELIRTGPGDFSKRAVIRWTELTGGHSSEGYPRYRDEKPIPVPTEEEAFKLLRWPWIEPWERK